MPYISETSRTRVDRQIGVLITELRHSFPGDGINGVLNYVISELICNCMRPTDGWNYAAIQNTKGLIVCIKDEFERRICGPYEKVVLSLNGDTPGFLLGQQDIKVRSER